MGFVRFASAAGPDARRRVAVDAEVSARRGTAADGSAPPQSMRTEFHTSLLGDLERVMGLLIKNGEIVTAENRWRGDIRCQAESIVELGVDLDSLSGEEVVDAADRLILPGGVDPHVHMSLPVMGTVSSDDFESGTKAAIAGGTTTIIDFVHPERGQNFLEALAARQARPVLP